jgi:hypothetical protein
MAPDFSGAFFGGDSFRTFGFGAAASRKLKQQNPHFSQKTREMGLPGR